MTPYDFVCNIAKMRAKKGYSARLLSQLIGRDEAYINKLENLKIPGDFDYDKIPGLSAESRLKLKEVRPETLGQASRISGIRTSDVMLLMVKLR